MLPKEENASVLTNLWSLSFLLFCCTIYHSVLSTFPLSLIPTESSLITTVVTTEWLRVTEVCFGIFMDTTSGKRVKEKRHKRSNEVLSSLLCSKKCMCMGVCPHVCLCTTFVPGILWRPEGLGPIGTGGNNQLTAAMWVLGTKARSSGIVDSTPSYLSNSRLSTLNERVEILVNLELIVSFKLLIGKLKSRNMNFVQYKVERVKSRRRILVS